MDPIEFYVLLPDGKYARVDDCQVVCVNESALTDSLDTSLQAFAGGEENPAIRSIEWSGSATKDTATDDVATH